MQQQGHHHHHKLAVAAGAAAALTAVAGGAYAFAMVPGLVSGLRSLGRGGTGAPIDPNPDTSVLRGRVCMITGPTSGLGLETARLLAGVGARLVLACHPAAPRDKIGALSNVAAVIDLDLADLASVRQFCAKYRATGLPAIDVLILNAGVITGHGERTKQGMEMTVGVNYLGHAVLTMELVANKLFGCGKSKGKDGWTPRLIATASEGHRFCPPLVARDFGTREFHYATAYGYSKLLLLSFVYELQRRLGSENVLCTALCPGVMRTKLAETLPLAGYLALVAVRSTMARDPADVAKEVFHLAASPEPTAAASWSGARYFSSGRQDTPRKDATDPVIGAQLWTQTERVIARIERGLPATTLSPAL